jgi:2-polyprenyl-6-methoxyphenol hydroxylase-like FAD-dependent oxidoreductase
MGVGRKITCVGGGPAGLYFAILAKRLDPDQAVTVFERGPEGTTYGWGVVFWDGLLEDLERTDPETAQQVRKSAFRWSDLVVQVDATPAVNEPGHGYSIRRQTLLSILSERARALGVELVFGREIEDFSELADSDLVVASDGVNSRLRQRRAEHFGTRVVPGKNKYIWLGTSKVFDSFTFPFVRTQAGVIWAHAYGFEAGHSTFIVETSVDTWRGLGFDGLSPDESMRLLERIFEASLDGHTLSPQAGSRDITPWLEFQTITNRSWHHGNLALMGDAAHTTHFTIGSGTRLALEDAIGLATQLREHSDIPAALTAYGRQRSGDLLEAQRTARNSALWFENVPRYFRYGTPELAELMSRRRSSFLRRMPPALYLWLIHAGSRAPAMTDLARRGVSGWRKLGRRWRRNR